MLPSIYKKAAGAGRRIADAIAGLRIDHFHHHANNVARRAELAVGAGGVKLGQQVLVEITLHVLVLRRNLKGVDSFARFDQQARLVDLELRVFHMLREGAARATKGFDERKDLFLDRLECLIGRKLSPVRPTQLLARESRRVLLAASLSGALVVLLLLVEALEEQQEAQLLDSIERVRQPA